MFCFGFTPLDAKLCTRISFFLRILWIFIFILFQFFFLRSRCCCLLYRVFHFLCYRRIFLCVAQSFAIFLHYFAYIHALTSKIFMICMLSYMCMESSSRKSRSATNQSIRTTTAIERTNEQTNEKDSFFHIKLTHSIANK